MPTGGAKATAGASRPGSLTGPPDRSGVVLGLFLGRAGGRACRPGGAVEALLDLADQIFEIVDLAGQRERLLPLGLHRLLGLGLLFLPLVDQQGDALALLGERRHVALQPLLLLGDLARMRTRSARSAASASACTRMSGSTAPSMMAVRTECSASSGRTIIAGGGLRPMRCSAASTSAMAARRPSSDWRMPARCRRAA